MKKIFIILLGLVFSNHGHCMDESVHKYFQKPEMLESDIKKIERTLNTKVSDSEREGLDKLKWKLIDIRENISAFENNNSLDDAYSLALSKNWTNVKAKIDIIKSICSSEAIASDECFLEISSFDSYIDSRNLTESNKQLFKTKIDSFSKHLQAKAILSNDFINETNALMELYNHLLMKPEAPLVTIKMDAIRDLPLAKMPSRVSNGIAFVTKDQPQSYSQFWIIVLACIVLFLVIGIWIKKRIKAKNSIKNFYGRIFARVRKNVYQTKVFGSINLRNSKKATKIEVEYLTFVSLIDSLKSNVDIKIKNRDNKLIIETVIYTASPLQETMKLDESKKLSSSIVELESKVFSLGGEVSISNMIDHTGKIINSNIILYV